LEGTSTIGLLLHENPHRALYASSEKSNFPEKDAGSSQSPDWERRDKVD
jgi:hypothetical protein